MTQKLPLLTLLYIGMGEAGREESRREAEMEGGDAMDVWAAFERVALQGIPEDYDPSRAAPNPSRTNKWSSGVVRGRA